MEKTELTDFAAISTGADMSTAQSQHAHPFSDSVRICSKCNRKLEEGKSLRKAVKTAIRNAYGDAVELEKVDCFSLCPKGGQAISTTNAAGQRRLVIVQPDSDVEIAVEYLLRGAT